MTRGEFERFTRAPVPREVPRGLARQVTSPGDGFVLSGAIMTFCGVGAAMFLVLDPYASPEPLFVGLAAGALLVGGVLLFLALRYRAGKLRLLRDGRLLRGHIAGIETTNVLINGEQRHLVKVRFEHEGRAHTAICPVHGSDVDGAKVLVASGGDTRILVDPGDHGRALCPELPWIDDADPGTVVRRG